MSYLPFISDEHLLDFTNTLVNAALSAQQKVEKDPYGNVIDPFSALVDAARQNISIDDWIEQEKSRQIQKSFQNAVGDFHQSVLGAVDGWQDAGEGGSYNIINEQKQIIAEIKNKHNTMNSGSQLQAYDKMAKWLDYGKPGYTAYVVDIVPKHPKPYCNPFTPAERGVRRQTRDNLLRIDGRSFYAIVTGYDDAIDQLYAALPRVLEAILHVDDEKIIGGEEFMRLFGKAYLQK